MPPVLWKPTRLPARAHSCVTLQRIRHQLDALDLQRQRAGIDARRALADRVLLDTIVRMPPSVAGKAAAHPMMPPP